MGGDESSHAGHTQCTSGSGQMAEEEEEKEEVGGAALRGNLKTRFGYADVWESLTHMPCVTGRVASVPLSFHKIPAPPPPFFSVVGKVVCHQVIVQK